MGGIKMCRVDCNCFVGGWPFHYVRENTFEKLKKLHEANKISSGFVSSTEAIFYNDPYEADEELSRTLDGSGYQHVVTVNPTLPGCCDSLQKMMSEFPVAGVRILPGFHGYSLQDQRLEKLCNMLSERNVPLFLTLRMEDERVTYLFHPYEIPLWDISRFISIHTNFSILICNARNEEISWLSNTFRSNKHVYADCCGLKNGLFGIEELYKEGVLDRIVYGSLAPIFCMKSSLLLIEKANIDSNLKDKILSGNEFLAHALVAAVS